eukprot:1159855-Pelagomonas_calceolata.AAC.11
MAPPKSAAVNHNAVLAAAECFALGKDGLSAKLCRAAVQILLQTGDGPLGPHSMVSTAYGAQVGDVPLYVHETHAHRTKNNFCVFAAHSMAQL